MKLQITSETTVIHKKGTNLFFIISSTNVGDFDKILWGCFVNKFTTKCYKNLLHDTIASFILTCKTLMSIMAV